MTRRDGCSLLAGTPMGVASARARAVTRKAGDATWLSFVVYAQPDAVLVGTWLL